MRKLAILLVLFCGCQKTVGKVPTVPVKGVVVLDERPVTMGRIVFMSAGNLGGVEPFGDLRRDGTFELSTQFQGDGAIVGKYKVWYEPINYAGKNPQKIPTSVPTKYHNSKTSPLEAEVRQDGNYLVLRMTSK